MCDSASCILYFKRNINTHVKNYVLADSLPSTIPPQASIITTAATMATTTTTTSASLNQQTRPC